MRELSIFCLLTCLFFCGLDTVSAAGNMDGTVLFDFETVEEREAVRKCNPDYGTLISVTNAYAASGGFSLRTVGMGDTDDAATGYLPRLLLRPSLTDWRDYDRLVVEVTSLRDSGANGRLRLFLAGPYGSYDNSIWLHLPLKYRGYRQWVVPLEVKWSKRLANISRLFFSFEDFADGCDVCIDRVMLLRKGADVPSASTAFIERMAMPLIAAARDDLAATNATMSAELAHVRDYVHFCGDASRSVCSSLHMAVGTATTMEKIRPRAEVAARAIPDSGLAVRLAGNEYESVQVVVAATGGDLRGVNVAVEGDLPLVESGKRKSEGVFSGTNIACEVVGYVNVTASSKCPSGYNVKIPAQPGYKRRNKKAERGWWPDPILSFTNAVDVLGTDVQSFWVRVHCPEGQPAGCYRGALLVSAEGVEPVRIPFSVRVNGFSLDRVSELPLLIDCIPVPTGNWRTVKIPDSPLNVWKRHETEWVDFLADYLISFDSIYASWGDTPFDLLERLRSQRLLGRRFCIGYVGNPKSTNDADVATWRTKTFDRLRKSYDEAKKRGLLDRAYIYGWDERPASEFHAVRLAAQEIKAEFQGVPLVTTAKDHKCGIGTPLDVVDCFCPSTWRWSPDIVAASRKAGHQVYWYVCDGPRAPWANMFIECQAIETRLLTGAMAQRMRPDGFLYYRINKWRGEHCIESGPFTDWLVEARQEGASNGDGYLTYVGRDGIPLPSIRLENFRDGLEDYAYAKLLEEKLRIRGKGNGERGTDEWIRRARAALSVPREVMDTMTNYTDDPAALYRWRDEMADLIEEANGITLDNQ